MKFEVGKKYVSKRDHHLNPKVMTCVWSGNHFATLTYDFHGEERAVCYEHHIHDGVVIEYREPVVKTITRYVVGDGDLIGVAAVPAYNQRVIGKIEIKIVDGKLEVKVL